jgi:hypothetical protein
MELFLILAIFMGIIFIYYPLFYYWLNITCFYRIL